MSDRLAGRVAIVTGAGRGIGRAIAEAFVAEGASVVVADNGTSLSGEGSDPTVARVVAKTLGERAVAFTESVASPGVAKQLVDSAIRNFGSIDIVVNNAAIRRDAAVFEADPGDWDAVIRTNMSAAFYLTSAASAIMRNSGRPGRIVNIVSSAGLYGARGQVAYAGAKAGLFGLTRASAMDLWDDDITVNAVVPMDGASGARPVADLVTALVSPAGKSITGQLLGVRDHKVFLLSHPRSIATIEVTSSGTLAEELIAAFAGQFTELTADSDA